MELLDKASDTKLILVSAPAGYGKTTLLCEWLPTCRFPFTWLTLDRGDNDPIRFLSYLIAALQQIDSHLATNALDALRSSGFESARMHSSMELGLTRLLNEVAEIHEPFFLVLDDYHLIVTARVHETISFLLDNQPPSLHLIIATRADPPLPLARLRARAQLTDVRADDLSFTSEETSAFLNEIMGLSLSARQIAALERRTEGWIAGMQLAALSMQGHDDLAGFIAAFTGSHRFILDYLTEEVFNRQTAEVQEFLLKTAILDQLTAPLCDAITGRADSQEILEAMDAANLFIVPLDDERGWFRYHQLLADVLQIRLQLTHPDWPQELHKRAVEWFEKNRFLEQAIRHAVIGKEAEKAAELIEQNAMSMLMQGELVTLLTWIEPIEDIIGDRPWLSTYKSWALMLTGQLDLAETWLRKAINAIPLSAQESGQEINGHIEAIRAYIAEARGEVDQTIGHAQKALELLPERDQAVRSVVKFTLGTAYRLTGDHARAKQALKAARRAGRMAGNRYLELGAVFTLADITFDQGKLHQAFDIYEEALHLATRTGGQLLPAAGMAYFGLGLVRYEWNDLESARRNTQQAIDLCQQWGHFVNLTGSLVLLSRIKLAQGDLEKAQQAIQRAEELTYIHSLALRAESWVEAFRARLWLAQGNLDAATRWGENSGIIIPGDFSYLREAEYFTLGHVYLANEKYDRVFELTQWLQNNAGTTGRMGSLIETLVLRALAFQATGDLAQALVSLEKALVLALPEGYTRVFINEGAQMVELLRRAGSQGIAPQFVAKLLYEFEPVSSKSGAPFQSLIEPLSQRELEVLQLLSEGLTNSDVAEKLVISVGTVKAHTASIYRKLNVHSRTQAVARVRALKMI